MYLCLCGGMSCGYSRDNKSEFKKKKKKKKKNIPTDQLQLFHLPSPSFSISFM
jgi:hypothetical protein